MTKLATVSKAIANGRIDFLREGFYRGVLAVQVEMSGAPLAFADVEQLMLELTTLTLPQRKIVRFSGAFVDDDINFMIFANSLSDHGFEVQAVVANGKSYAWLKWCSWLIVTTSSKLVLMTSNEVWYTPSVLEDLVLPTVGKMPFLFIGGRHGVDDIVAFMCASRLTWATL